jgi:hypothetical protein
VEPNSILSRALRIAAAILVFGAGTAPILALAAAGGAAFFAVQALPMMANPSTAALGGSTSRSWRCSGVCQSVFCCLRRSLPLEPVR